MRKSSCELYHGHSAGIAFWHTAEKYGTRYDVMMEASSSPNARWFSSNGGAEYEYARKDMTAPMTKPSFGTISHSVSRDRSNVKHPTRKACVGVTSFWGSTFEPPVIGVPCLLSSSEETSYTSPKKWVVNCVRRMKSHACRKRDVEKEVVSVERTDAAR